MGQEEKKEETVQPYTNRLAHEKSPYLLQHADNPVDWYPWGAEAFERSKAEKKPIFLSIGYASCHWCHVMEEESFSDPEIARLINENFIPIKVDREERPDIDTVYMRAVVALQGSGGWPMTLFLTPDGTPFYGGTYYAPDDRFDRPGLKTILHTISDAWKKDREKLETSAAKLADELRARSVAAAGDLSTLNRPLLDEAYAQYLRVFDQHDGGFGDAPKFPAPQILSFLLRYWNLSQEKEALAMVEKTLDAMAAGGIYDHIGGGFHRYATDRAWRVPHFEKMLIDQALLARVYLEAYQATGKRRYAVVARETLDYMLRDLVNPDGVFSAAEDAESAPDARYPEKKEEGAYYLWRTDEVGLYLGTEDALIVSDHFGFRPEGNVQPDKIDPFKEKNIPYTAQNLADIASRAKITIPEANAAITRGREKLFAARGRRPRPALDDQVLTDWNGLAISSLAYASSVLNEPRYLDAAKKAAAYVLKVCVNGDGRILHCVRGQVASTQGMLGDYAFLISGLYDLYEASFDPAYLVEAKRFSKDMVRLFWDKEAGGLFSTANDAEQLFLRVKDPGDAAAPSAQSVAALDLLRLGRLTSDEELSKKGREVLAAFAKELHASPSAYAQALVAIIFIRAPDSWEVVITGKPGERETTAMLRSIYGRYLPNAVVVFMPTSGEGLKAIIDLVPFLKERRQRGAGSTAYLCRNYACETPATSAAELGRILSRKINTGQ